MSSSGLGSTCFPRQESQPSLGRSLIRLGCGLVVSSNSVTRNPRPALVDFEQNLDFPQCAAYKPLGPDVLIIVSNSKVEHSLPEMLSNLTRRSHPSAQANLKDGDLE
jgi:hypothetical protein